MNKLTHTSGQAHRSMTVLVLILVLLAWNSSIHAQPDKKRRVPPSWHGDISNFHPHDWDIWRGGHWDHGRHDGRVGWWWVIGNIWYFYPSPMYPYPSPWEPSSVIVINPPGSDMPRLPPPTQYWYYCDTSRSYYPYVPYCAGGWRQVPATPGNMATPPAQ